MATLITKNSSTASSVPTAAQLVQGELAVNVSDKRLFTENASGTVVELGTNPSSLELPNGTANGVAYLNGSKVLTTGSALTFDGTNLGVAMPNPASYLGKFGVNGNIALGTGGQQYFWDAANAFGWIIGNPGNSLAFSNYGGSEQMRLTSTGLGIGTSSPAYKLDLSTSYDGRGRVWIAALAFVGNNSNGTGYQLRTPTSTSDGLVISNGGNSAEWARFDSSGNLGLGVTPSASTRGKGFDIGLTGGLYGDGITVNFSTHLTNNAYPLANGNWVYKNSSQVAQRYSMESSGQHQWYTASSGTAGNAISFTQAMTLDASGNLLVGTTSASGKIAVDGGSGVAGYFKNSIASGDYTLDVNNNAASGTRRYVNFSISGTSTGEIYSAGTVTVYGTTSDYRLKTVIGAVTGHGERIDALEPVEYTWNTDGSRTRGFLAHKFQEVYADSVSGTKDAVDANGNPKYQSMQAGSSEVIADLVAEIQSLRKRLAAAGIA